MGRSDTQFILSQYIRIYLIRIYYLWGLVEKLSECPHLQDIYCREVPADSLLKTLRKRGIYFRHPTPRW